VLAAAEMSLDPQSVRRLPGEWIGAVQGLVDEARVDQLGADDRELHGRLFLYGLGKLDQLTARAVRAGRPGHRASRRDLPGP